MKVLPEPEPWHESMSRTPVRDTDGSRPARESCNSPCPQEPRVGPDALEPSHMVVIPARTGDTNHYRPGNGCRESNERPVGLGKCPQPWARPAGRPSCTVRRPTIRILLNGLRRAMAIHTDAVIWESIGQRQFSGARCAGGNRHRRLLRRAFLRETY